MSIPLTFGELAEGKTFIAFPSDGDDSGHGGYRQSQYVFTKLRLSKGSQGENTVRNCDGVLLSFPNSFQVLIVE
jgi:hypothetical protein